MASEEASIKSLTFRVEGLPAACDRAMARTLVEVAARLNVGCSDMKVHSVAASAVCAGEKTATVTSDDLASALKPAPPQARRWTLDIAPEMLPAAFVRSAGGNESDEDGFEISIDTHFEGFTSFSSFDDDEQHKLE
jgi:hypothetical protein